MTVLTLQDVADRYQVSIRYVYTLIEKHGLPLVRIGSLPRFVESDLIAWEAKQRQTRQPLPLQPRLSIVDDLRHKARHWATSKGAAEPREVRR